MKYLRLLTISLLLIFFQCKYVQSQGVLNKYRTHRALIEFKNGDFGKSKNRVDKIDWVNDSTKNTEYNFRNFYLQKSLSEFRFIDNNSIENYNDTIVILSNIGYLNFLKKSFKLYEDKKEYYRRKYGISNKSFDNLITLLENRLKFLRDEAERIEAEKRRRELEEGIKSMRVKTDLAYEAFVKMTNNTLQKKSFKKLEEESNGKLLVSYKETVTIDSTTFSFLISYNKEAFEPGVYYDKDVEKLLISYLSYIKDETIGNGREVRITAIGSADSIPAESLSYIDQSSIWGSIPLTETQLNDQTKKIEVQKLSPLTNSKIAFLRAYNIQHIISSEFGKDYAVHKYVLTDYENQLGKYGQEYRTTGFIIVTETFNKELRDRIDRYMLLMKPADREKFINQFPIVREIYKDENGMYQYR